MSGAPDAPGWARWVVRVAGWGLLAVVALALAAPADDAAAATPEQLRAGAALYDTACVSCHGPAGEGVEERGPTLLDSGAAGTDFVMRTGRMPLAAPSQQGVRGPVRYDDDEIEALVAYVAALPDQVGPAVPDPDPARGDAAQGGSYFRRNCATCHQAAGQGGALVVASVPSLSLSTPTEVAEAMLVGPGAMPVFSAIDQQTVDDVTAYVVALQEQDDPGGAGIGRTGPFAEGLVAWGVGLLALLLFARWVGTRME